MSLVPTSYRRLASPVLAWPDPTLHRDIVVPGLTWHGLKPDPTLHRAFVLRGWRGLLGMFASHQHITHARPCTILAAHHGAQ